MKAKFLVPIFVFITAVVAAFLLLMNPSPKTARTASAMVYESNPTSVPTQQHYIQATRIVTKPAPVTNGTCKVPPGYKAKVESDKNGKYMIGLANFPETSVGNDWLISYDAVDESTVTQKKVVNPSSDFKVDFYVITLSMEDKTVLFTYPQEGSCLVERLN